ncbi:MAG: hypothetical protein GF332_01165 [Candidatus Moranbacteria bacterium]|nr:hypothetical protein [Candidatus Moranbacteria bacterium]
MTKKAVYFLIILTLVLTLPVLTNFFSQIPGKYSDTIQVWGKTQEFRNRFNHHGLLATLAWQFKAKKFTPLEATGWAQIITNPFAGYNLVWLAAFFIAALGMYLLANYLTNSRTASLIAAVVFAFTPFHFAQAISTNIGTMHYEWLPFFILFLIKFLRDLKFKDFLLFSLFLILIALAEHQVLAFTLIFAILLVFFFLVKNSEILVKLKFWIYGLTGILILLLAVKLIFGGLFQVTQTQDNYLDPGKDQVLRYSTDLVEFFTPHRLHPWWGEKYNYLRENTTANAQGRQANYIGYVVIFLSLVSLLSLKKRPWVKLFFFFSALLFTALSLGPELRYQGELIPGVWLPYNLLYDYVPYWYIIRTVNRIFLIAIFCYAISGAFGIKFLLEKLRFPVLNQKIINLAGRVNQKVKQVFKKRPKLIIKLTIKLKQWLINFQVNRLIALLFLFLLIIEYLCIPVPLMSMTYSPFYDRLREMPEQFNIIDIPGSTSYDYGSKLLYYENIHLKHNYAGIDFARVVEDKWDFQQNTPVLYDLLYSLPTGGTPPSKSIINDYYYNLATKIFNFYNIKYVIISKIYRDTDKKFDGQAYENTINFISGQFNSEKVYEDSLLVAYEIKQSEHLDGWFLAMDLKDDYWSRKKGKRGSVARWARDGAKIRLVNMGESPQNIRLLFDTKIKSNREVDVYLNGKEQDSFTTKKEKEEHSIDLINVQPGENQIVFRIFTPEGHPVDTYELKKGVRFSNIRTMSLDQ